MATSKKKTAKKPTAKRVLLRTQSAGVHFGTLVSRTGSEAVLNGSRRIWRWYGANTLSELATAGLDSTKSRVAVPVDGHTVLGVIEVLPVSEAAASTIEASKWAP